MDAYPMQTLAQKCNVPKSHLRRWMRHAISKRIFRASTKDSVAHTITSAECVRDETVWAWIGHNVEEVGPAAGKLIEQTDRFGDSNNPSEAAVALSHFDGTWKGLFEWFENDSVGEREVPTAADGEVDRWDRTVD